MENIDYSPWEENLTNILEEMGSFEKKLLYKTQEIQTTPTAN